MVFERTGIYTRGSSEGYVVAAVKLGGGWVFEAHGPKRATVFHRDGRITTGGQLHQVSYARGEETPTQRDHLGVFRPADHGGVDAAREAAIEACQQHHEGAGPPGVVPHGNAAPREFASHRGLLRGLCDAS